MVTRDVSNVTEVAASEPVVSTEDRLVLHLTDYFSVNRFSGQLLTLHLQASTESRLLVSDRHIVNFRQRRLSGLTVPTVKNELSGVQLPRWLSAIHLMKQVKLAFTMKSRSRRMRAWMLKYLRVAAAR